MRGNEDSLTTCVMEAEDLDQIVHGHGRDPTARAAGLFRARLPYDAAGAAAGCISTWAPRTRASKVAPADSAVASSDRL